jgi:aminopeptidase N
MEHQTLIAYGHDFQTGGLGYDAAFDALHFHELAHEWFGNCLTVKGWKDFWLHEGTATYLEALYAESLEGEDAYHEIIGHARRQIANQRPIARASPATAQEMYDRDSLQTVLSRFLSPGSADGQACRHVGTDDFLSVAESVADRSLDGFAETYLYQASLPRLDTTRTRESLRLEWKNTAGDGFAVPVHVRVADTTRRVSMDGGTGRIAVPTDAPVQIDPEGWVLRAK